MWAGAVILAGGILLLGGVKHFFKSLIRTMVTGLAVLMVLWLTRGLTGVYLPLTVWNTAVAAILGIPGVIFLLIIPLLLS